MDLIIWGGGGSILSRPSVVLSRIILDKAKLFEEFRPVEYYEGFGVTAASLGHSLRNARDHSNLNATLDNVACVRVYVSSQCVCVCSHMFGSLW